MEGGSIGVGVASGSRTVVVLVDGAGAGGSDRDLHAALAPTIASRPMPSLTHWT